MSNNRHDNLMVIVRQLLEGNRRAAGRLISMVENGAEDTKELMKLVYPHTGKSMIIGLTGSGGSGKSSLINHLIRSFRRMDYKVGVVAIDPSSPFSGGAILGDRIRFQQHSLDDGVFIRSMGSRGYIGGLARATADAVRILEAMGNEVVIIETLGVGQDEIDIIHLAQTCLLVLTPGMGDDIQAMKAGVMEIADLIVMNKADLEGAEGFLHNLEATVFAAAAKAEGAWRLLIIPTVAVASKSKDIEGIDKLMEAIMAHQNYIRDHQVIKDLHTQRIEQELGLIFKDEMEKLVFAGLKGTGKKRQYIEAIMQGRNDPYSVVQEVLETFLSANRP